MPTRLSAFGRPRTEAQRQRIFELTNGKWNPPETMTEGEANDQLFRLERRWETYHPIRPNYVGPDGRVRHEVVDFVYFIRMGDDGPIKIGHAIDPKQRLADLQTGNPHKLHLLHAIEGGEALERQLHRELAPHRLEGEWFQSTQTVLEVMLRESARAHRVREEKARARYEEQLRLEEERWAA